MIKRHLYITSIFLLLFPFASFSKDYNILAFNAIPDAKTINTSAIQLAIDKAHKDGGGRVVIPSGRFLTGSIVLKSNVELHILKKGVLLGSTQSSDYTKSRGWRALIVADGVKNIAISGKGTIDGQGAKLALNIDSLFYIGQIDSSQYRVPERRPRYDLRPQIIEFINCKNIKITGVSIKNSACWVQTYERCQNLIIDKIKVESDAYWNNDGIDIVDCKNVRITNCFINSADDGICIKSYYPFDRNFKMSKQGINMCDSIYVANCIVRSSGCAIKLGTASFGGFKNIIVRNIKVYDTFRSAIALEMVNGSILKNVTIENIKAVNTGNAIFIRLGHRNGKRDFPVGVLQDITIKNIKVKVPFKRTDYEYEIRGPELPFFHNVFPSSIVGLPGHPVENVLLENIKIIYPGRGNAAFANMPVSRLSDVPENADHYPEFSMFGELPAWGFYVRHVDGLSMKDIAIKIKKPDYRPAFVFDDVKNLTLQSFEIGGDKKSNPIILNNVKGEKIQKK